MSTDIKVILFDADGVIQKSTSDFILSLETLAQSSQKQQNIDTNPLMAVGIQPPTAKRFIEDIIAAEQPCMVSDEDFPNAVQKVLDAWQIKVPISEVMTLWHDITVFDEIIEVVKNLQNNGFSCGLATNQQSYRMQVMRNNLDYDSLFDFSFYSCEMGIKKPDTKYFEYIVSTLNMPAPQLLFIDDKEANVNSAKQVGLQAFSFNANKSPNRVQTLIEKFKQYSISFDA